MDRFQRKLRVYIAAGSAVGFLGGWALLAHAGKPVSSASANAPVDLGAPAVVVQSQNVTLPPIDFKALENGSTTTVQPLNLQSLPQPQTFFRPRLRTAGS